MTPCHQNAGMYNISPGATVLKRPDEKRPDEKRPDEKRPDENRPDEISSVHSSDQLPQHKSCALGGHMAFLLQ